MQSVSSSKRTTKQSFTYSRAVGKSENLGGASWSQRPFKPFSQQLLSRDTLIPPCANENRVNPDWHELWEQEKCSSLAPHGDVFYKTQWVYQGVKLTRLMYKVWKFLVKIQQTKSDPKRIVGRKVPCLMPIRVNGVGVAAISAKIWNGDFPLHPSVSEGPALLVRLLMRQLFSRPLGSLMWLRLKSVLSKCTLTVCTKTTNILLLFIKSWLCEVPKLVRIFCL